MKLSISGRLWETSSGYRIHLGEHISIARQLGYHGIEIRYPLLPFEAQIETARAQLQLENIIPVFCSCAEIPHDATSWNDAMRVVRTVHKLGGTFVRIALINENDLPMVRELARYAGDFDIRVLLHFHINTLCDTSVRAHSLLDRINHPSVGLLLDPIHLFMAGESNPLAAIERISPWIGLLNIQNYRRTVPQNTPEEVEGCQDFWKPVSPQTRDGLDFDALRQVMKKVGYNGWVNVMCSTLPDENPIMTAKAYFETLASWRIQTHENDLTLSH